MMIIQSRAASAGDVEKIQVASQKPLHGRLIGRVEDRAARSAPPRYLIS